MSISTGTLANAPVEKTAEIGQHVTLSDEAKAPLQDGPAPGAYLNVLIEKGHFIDAVRFLAHAPPKREAVWWASQCARSVAGTLPRAPIAHLLGVSRTTVRDRANALPQDPGGTPALERRPQAGRPPG